MSMPKPFFSGPQRRPGPESRASRSPQASADARYGRGSAARVVAFVLVAVTVLLALYLGDYILIPIGALLGLIPGKLAASKGRDFATWWAYGFLVFIVALVHSLLIKKAQRADL